MYEYYAQKPDCERITSDIREFQTRFHGIIFA